MRTLYRAKAVFEPRGKTLDEFVVEEGFFSSFIGKIDREVYLDGYVYPGFIDAHAHLIGTGIKSLTPSLEEVKKIDELLEISSKAEVEILRGWNDEVLGRYPKKEELDEIDRPILLVRRCGHVGVANTLFLKKVDIESEDGVLKEEILAKALQSASENVENVKKAVKAGEKVFFSYGVTTVHSDDMYSLSLETVEEVLKTAVIDVYEHYHVHSLNELKRFIEEKKTKSVKVLLDGSLGARTAYLRESYSDANGNKGMLNFSREEFKEIVRLANENDIQVAVHAIGDGALDVALEAFEGCKPELRNRLIHVQISHPEQIEKIKSLNLCVDVQPQFFTSDADMARKRLGERTKYAYKFKELLEIGIHTAFSSDSPVEIPDPLEGMRAAGKMNISVTESLKAYTFEGAYQEFSENEKGGFSDGMKADFVLFDLPIKSGNAILMETYKAGQLVWKRKEK